MHFHFSGLLGSVKHIALLKQGKDKQGLIVNWHRVPVYPGGQMQLKVFGLDWEHVALFKHGELWHESIIVWHLSPVNPIGQLHLKLPLIKSSIHCPPLHGECAQRRSLTSHLSPVNKGGHSQVYELFLLIHAWNPSQGEDKHGLEIIWTEQSGPVYPFEQIQLKFVSSETQSPLKKLNK